MDGKEVDEFLTELEENVPVSPGMVDLPDRSSREVIVFGDTHGDWRSTLALERRFLEDPTHRYLVGLGDYIDRPPDDCAEGSVANALHLLSVVAMFPDRVWLIQGNHETVRKIPVLPEHLAEEVDQLWGPHVERYGRIVGLLERGPLSVLVPGRAYLAHAGFPRGVLGAAARDRFAAPDEETLLDVVWRECGASRIRRGLGPPFTEREMETFLASLGTRVFVRGHDPDLTNRPVYSGRCLTLHTSRLYERFGGVVIARIPLDTAVQTTQDLVIEHLETEGRTYPEPRSRDAQ